MVVQDQAGNRLENTQVQPVTVSSGTGTASFAASTRVPDTAQEILVFFALFVEGETVTRTVDSVRYFVRK
jgi:hypothetical protein